MREEQRDHHQRDEDDGDGEHGRRIAEFVSRGDRGGDRGAEHGGSRDLRGNVLVNRADGFARVRAVGQREHRIQQAEQREEDRHLDQHRHTGRKWRRAVIAVERHHFFLLALLRDLIGAALVLLLDLLDFGLKFLTGARCARLLVKQRNDQDTDNNREAHDRQHPRWARTALHSDHGEKFMHSVHDVRNDPHDGVEDGIHRLKLLMVRRDHRHGHGWPDDLFRCRGTR